MLSRNRLAALLSALALSLVIVGPAAAQEAEETEAPAAPAVDAQPASATGSASFLDVTGLELGTITIRDTADPYTAFEPTRPPAEGQRYVLLEVLFEAAEDQAFPTDPRQVQLQDSAGFLYGTSGVPRPADDTLPDLQSQTLAPFDRVRGAIGYLLPADVPIARIVYRGDGSRLIPIAAPIPSAEVAVGEAKSHTDQAGNTLGTITVREVADPYTDFEPNRPPAEGQRFVLVTVAFEAADDQAMFADPRAIYLVDDRGAIHRPGQVSRPAGGLLQALEPQPLSPSDRVSGVIGYIVPDDVALVSVIYASESNRFAPVAGL